MRNLAASIALLVSTGASGIEVKSYLQRPIVVASVAAATAKLLPLTPSQLEERADWVCQSLGYDYATGSATLTPLRDQGNREAIMVHEIVAPGVFKLKAAHQLYALRGVECLAPEEPSCAQDHFGLADVKHILYRRQECE